MEHFLTALIWGFSGFIHGMSGFGGAILAVTVLSLFLPLTFLVPLAIITSLGINLTVIYSYWRDCDYKILGTMLLASLPGLILGTYALKVIPNAYLQFIMGACLLIFILWQYLHKKNKNSADRLWIRLFASFIAGFSFTSTSLGGPPLAVYVLYANWSPQKVLGTTSAFFLLLGLISVPTLAEGNLFSPTLIEYAIVSTLSTVVGIQLSFKVMKKGGEKLFVKSLLIIILISALLCLYSSTKVILGF